MSDEDGTLVKYSESISTMPPVLVFPFSNRPLFPGVYQPCEVTNEGLVAAWSPRRIRTTRLSACSFRGSTRMASSPS